jgi:hypothetical protein
MAGCGRYGLSPADPGGKPAAGYTEKGDKFMAHNVYGFDGVMRRCW